jgi:hypothetical protein
MILLDENIPEGQRRALRRSRVALRQIGVDLGRAGMKDDEIFPLLHGLSRPTFFTCDSDFNHYRVCHPKYCLVYLDVDEGRVAEFVRRLLGHPKFNTKTKRMGLVIRIDESLITVRKYKQRSIRRFGWE